MVSAGAEYGNHAIPTIVAEEVGFDSKSLPSSEKIAESRGSHHIRASGLRMGGRKPALVLWRSSWAELRREEAEVRGALVDAGPGTAYQKDLIRLWR